MAKHHAEGDSDAEGSEPTPPREKPRVDDERRAQKARRVVTTGQVVLAIAQAVDGVLRIFS
ncbi:hypothetical protein GCM10027199_77520 [Amycolatopsis magusensis]